MSAISSMKITRLLCRTAGAAAPKILFHGVVVLALAYAPCIAQAEGWKLSGKELHPWSIIKEPVISSAWKKAVSSARVPKEEQFWVQDMESPPALQTL